MHRILVVEDDPAMSKLLAMLFEANGFRVVVANTCELGISKTHSQRPDMCILDLGLPDRDGIDFVREVRTCSPVPIIVVTARTHELQRLAAFEAGVDDYVIKPFNSLELLARVRAILRRAERRDHPDLQNHLPRGPHGDEVRLTPLEHRILECLVRHTGSVVSYERIFSEVWGPGHTDVRALRVHVAMLRRKLEIDPAQPRYIQTQSGVGYRLAAQSAAIPSGL